MEDQHPVRYYVAADIEVNYDRARCIHAGECLRRLPAVFDTSRRPWILPDAALPDEIAAAVEHCPSGALHYARLDGGAQEVGDSPTTITPRRNGPLFVRGQIQLRAADGKMIDETRMTLCRCGASNNKPFCDNSHRRIGFRDSSDAALTTDSHGVIDPGNTRASD